MNRVLTDFVQHPIIAERELFMPMILLPPYLDDGCVHRIVHHPVRIGVPLAPREAIILRESYKTLVFTMFDAEVATCQIYDRVPNTYHEYVRRRFPNGILNNVLIVKLALVPNATLDQMTAADEEGQLLTSLDRSFVIRGTHIFIREDFCERFLNGDFEKHNLWM